jgi:hypothetical protein
MFKQRGTGGLIANRHVGRGHDQHSRSFCDELKGRLEFKTSEKGSSFQFSIPVHTLTPYSDPHASPLVH